jgi:osmotically-inducible protein OsmY
MQTEMLHGDVIIGMFTYDDLDHELDPMSTLSDGDMSGYVPAQQRWLADEEGPAWRADDNQEWADRHMQRLRDITGRADADVRRDVLRALLLDSLVPLSVDAQVSDGVVTLTGTVGSERERKDATYLAGCVTGVVGVLDELADRPHPVADDDEATRDAVMAALACTSIADVADLTVGGAGWGTVMLSGAVQSRSDRDLAIAIALSVAGVDAVEDCIQVES